MTKEMIKTNIVIYIIFVCIYGCNFKDHDKIQTIALVVPNSYRGDIIIFYDQTKNIGKIKEIRGKHYFYVNKDGIFFTSLKLGDGLMEFYDEKLNEREYFSSMQVERIPNDSFQVIGGAYRGITSDLYKNGKVFVDYTVFKAGVGSELKNGKWFLSDSAVKLIYENKMHEIDNKL